MSDSTRSIDNYRGSKEVLDLYNKHFTGYENVSIEYITDGIKIIVPNLTYIFQISCFEYIGWNVFLVSVGESVIEDKEVDKIYENLEEDIDLINIKYYDFTDEQRIILDNSFDKLKTFSYDLYAENPNLIKRLNDTGRYTIQLFIDSLNYIEIGYSRIMDKWFYSLNDIDSDNNILLQSCINKASSLIAELNSIAL